MQALRPSLMGVALAFLAAHGALAAAPDTLTPDQLRPGQRAIVRTVFQGDSVEEFPAEIVGVLPGGRAEGDLILARATTERLQHMGVAQGMSGSPVYVNGKLIGALSSGWTFSRDPLFGITPIGEMLHVLTLPAAPVSGQTAGPTGVDLAAVGTPRFREFRWDGDTATAPAIPAAPAATPLRTGMPAALPIPLACAGLDPAVLGAAHDLLAPLGLSVVPGGRAPDGGPTADALVPGAAVAVDVLRGDLQFSAIGTVTWRDGDNVLIFGHPFFQSGPVRMPLSTARITTVVANEASSFKLGVRGREVGVATQDRRAAVAGTLGGRARMLPVVVSVHAGDGAPQVFHFESIEDRTLAPTLIALAAINSLLESGGSGANQTLRYAVTMARHGAAPLTIRDLAAGDSPAGDLVSGIASPIKFLLGNPYQPVTLDSVRIAIDAVPGRAEWTLRGARLLDPVVRPGGRARVACDVERWHGERVTRVVSVLVPDEAPAGRYVLWVGGSDELSHYEATRLPGRYRPVSLDDAWQRLGAMRPPEQLYAALFANAPEVTTSAVDYPELPGSAVAVLSGTQSAGDLARVGTLAELDETRAAMNGELRGELQLTVTVDDRAP